jgi:hypothetical protein
LCILCVIYNYAMRTVIDTKFKLCLRLLSELGPVPLGHVTSLFGRSAPLLGHPHTPGPLKLLPTPQRPCPLKAGNWNHTTECHYSGGYPPALPENLKLKANTSLSAALLYTVVFQNVLRFCPIPFPSLTTISGFITVPIKMQ